GLLRLVRLLLSIFTLHGELLRAGEPAGAANPGHLVLLEEELDALRVLRAHGTGSLHRNAEVQRDIADVHAELRSMSDPGSEVCGFQESLRRNAPPEDAGAAERLTLDDGRREAELSAADGAYVGRRAAAQEDDVVRSHVRNGVWDSIALRLDWRSAVRR